MNEIDVSVLICTRNRADSLARTLRTISAMTVPDGVTWEVVVVDNGSSDHTAAVLLEFAGVLPLRPVTAPEPGVSHARNCAVAAARGRYLVWTDDDVLVPPEWLATYIAAFRSWPEAAVFGGPIRPALEQPATPWFRASLDVLRFVVAARDFGPAPCPLSIAGDRLPFGANFAVRAAEQRRHPFDRALGVAPGRARAGEETAVLEALLREGASGWYVPGAGVQHVIARERQTVAYVIRYFAAIGATAAAREALPTGRHAFGVPPWLWRRVATKLLRYLWLRAVASPPAWTRALTEYGFARGYFVETRLRHYGRDWRLAQPSAVATSKDQA